MGLLHVTEPDIPDRLCLDEPRSRCALRRETFSFAFQNSDVPARSGWFGLKVPAPKPKRTAFPAEDVTFLRSLSQGLNRIGLILPDRA